VLAEFGGFEIAMMSGAMLAAAERGLLLLIDGFIVTSALLVAARLAPRFATTASSATALPSPAIWRNCAPWMPNRCSISACASAREPAPRSPGRWCAPLPLSSTRWPASRRPASAANPEICREPLPG
jgi:hypothetical protein